MKATITDAVFFKDSIKIISELISEAYFTFTKDGVEMRAMTPDNTSYVTFRIPGSRFTEYEVEKDTEVALNFSYLKNILSRASESDVLTLECKDKKPSKFSIQLLGERKRRFNIPVIEDLDHDKRQTEFKFTVETQLDSDAISETVADAALVAESMRIFINNKVLRIIAEPDKFDLSFVIAPRVEEQ